MWFPGRQCWCVLNLLRSNLAIALERHVAAQMKLFGERLELFEAALECVCACMCGCGGLCMCVCVS